MKLNDMGRLLVLAACVCLATELVAQGAPVPPIQGTLAPVFITDSVETPVTPDEHPLTGGQVLGIGTWGPRHSSLTPSLSASEMLDSNPLLLSSNDGSYRGFTSLGGNLQWTQYMGRNAELFYSGTLLYDTRARIQGYSQFTSQHLLTIEKNIRSKTWNLLLDDQVQYSQGSSFGESGMEGTGLTSNPLQSTSSTLQQTLLPNQSILIGRTSSIANTALIEVDKHLGARDTATLAASYGLLKFDSSLLADTNQVSVVGGYDRRVSARNSIALGSTFTHFSYTGNGTTLSTESVSALYALRIPGRSSLELGAGPQITQSSTLGTNQQYLGWQASGTVRYRIRQVNLGFGGMRAITGGSGVLYGALTTTGRVTADFLPSRNWLISLHSGASRNQPMSSAQGVQIYDTQFAGVILNRKYGRYTNLFTSYDFQHQTNGSVCTGPACGYSGLRNVFAIGLSWDYRPISVE